MRNLYKNSIIFRSKGSNNAFMPIGSYELKVIQNTKLEH